MYTRLLQTAFYTSLGAYLGFALLEYVEPGFISFSFSPHLAGLFALICGAMMTSSPSTVHHDTFFLRYFLPLALGIVLALVVWNEGEAFGDFRLLLALGCFVLPWLTRRLLAPS